MTTVRRHPVKRIYIPLLRRYITPLQNTLPVLHSPPPHTRRPQELDDAVRRRLVKRIYIPLPDEQGRLAILTHLLTGVCWGVGGGGGALHGCLSNLWQRGPGPLSAACRLGQAFFV